MEPQAMTIRVPGDLYEQLRRAAFEARVPMNALINEGIELKLAHAETIREALRLAVSVARESQTGRFAEALAAMEGKP